jgi:diguanylate cyclase (GGDEF)-like protein
MRSISWLHSSLTVPTDNAVILSVGLDITDKKHSEEQMLWMANHDVLTELYNRRKFNYEFERILVHANRYQHEGMLLFLDLDQFKDINDSCGHKIGDQLLRRVSKSLLSITRSTDLVARLGGDEFAIILPESSLDGAVTLCEKITETLDSLDFSHEQVRYTVSCSIGIIKFPLNDLTVDELVSNADLAMYQAKSKGKNTWHLFTFDDMARVQLQARIRWKQKIEDALTHHRFTLFYQPIMEIQSRTVNHYEVLLRMRDENNQIYLPGAFIQVAEQTGLIHRIDHYVLEQGIAKLAELDKQQKDISLSLNLSGHAIVDPDLTPLLKRLLADYGAPPHHLIFELTETAAVADIPQARELMQEMNKQGCRFSIDDFGTGFSSFRYLRELPVDIVKIDGSFITHITENADDRLFVQALVTVAKGMGKKTVAEFVENAQTLAMIQALGVDYAQGYYIGKPQEQLLSGPPKLD